jgi:hypothetical protein
MVYRFILLSDEVDNFRRDITIDADATFFDLHNAILESVDYTKDQMTSFFTCNGDWSKETEITLVEMDSSSEEDNYLMESTYLRDLVEEEHQKLLYVFEYLTDRCFFIELREIITGKHQKKAEVIRSEGKAPIQLSQLDDLDFTAPAVVHNSDDDDFSDDEFNFDEYDDEDLANLSEGNPFDDY